MIQSMGNFIPPLKKNLDVNATQIALVNLLNESHSCVVRIGGE